MIEPLPLDMARETRMFRALVRLLQSDETLQRVIPESSWQVSDGDDDKPFAEVALPAIRLNADLEKIELRSPENYYEGLLVSIEFGVLGTNVDDRLNLWAAIRDALQAEKAITIGDNPDGTSTTATTVNEYLRQAGAMVGFWVQSGKLVVPSQPNQTPSKNQYARAIYFLGAFTPG